jgi:hypothetical protein
MSIKIGTLTRERREGKATLTIDEQGEVRTEQIRISFRKPTEALWRELIASEKSDGEQDKATLVAQLIRLEIQSPDIVNEDDTVHALTEADLNALDMAQLAELWMGVRDHFFLQTPASTSETNMNSPSAQEAAA